jgi:uncharacterized protein
MSLTRRQFLEKSAYAGTGFTIYSVLGSYMCEPLWGEGETSPPEDFMAYYNASKYAPYVSQQSTTGANATTWLQLDMAQTQAIDRVILYPAIHMTTSGILNYADQNNFPVRFKIEASDDPQFQSATIITDQTAADFPDPHTKIVEFPAKAKGRYLRLTVTKLNTSSPWVVWPTPGGYMFALAKIDVLTGNKNVAELCPVTADPTLGNGAVSRVNRRTRPMGEGSLTNNPQNVIPVDQWKPVAYAAVSPVTGVTLGDGPFKTAMETNISYLLKETADDLLQCFRTRAGKPNPPNLRKLDGFWDKDLAGSGAGRFLMASGNTLRWMDHPQLRAQMNAIVDGIADCAEPDGYLMAYPRDTIFYSERGAYTRSWVTQGLIEAGYSGNKKAFDILRPYYDWYNKCEYRPKLLRGCGMAPQGMVANTRLHFTPVGKPDDIHVIQQFFQENYLLDGLVEREPEMIWQYPYDRPHSYQITFFEAYLDLYRATGHQHYLDAMIGGWDLYHDHWEHLGGSISITEFEDHPPDSYRLLAGTGEFCGNVFWARFNSRFLQLFPEQEKYANEIEKSIYNVGLANQLDDSGIIYHAKLTERKEDPSHINTCCEGQGSRFFGSLPEYIFSLAPDGLYINQFTASTIKWDAAGAAHELKMETQFPFKPDVVLTLTTPAPTAMKLRVRIPTWAARDMEISVNGTPAITGHAGTYVTLDRTWATGDKITFTLPMEFRITRYTGVDKVPDHPTYGLEYGPILYGMVADKDFRLVTDGPDAESLLKQLVPKDGEPLHFTIAGNDAHEFMPYWQVKKQRFTCFPIIDVA